MIIMINTVSCIITKYKNINRILWVKTTGKLLILYNIFPYIYQTIFVWIYFFYNILSLKDISLYMYIYM